MNEHCCFGNVKGNLAEQKKDTNLSLQTFWDESLGHNAIRRYVLNELFPSRVEGLVGPFEIQPLS